MSQLTDHIDNFYRDVLNDFLDIESDILEIDEELDENEINMGEFISLPAHRRAHPEQNAQEIIDFAGKFDQDGFAHYLETKWDIPSESAEMYAHNVATTLEEYASMLEVDLGLAEPKEVEESSLDIDEELPEPGAENVFLEAIAKQARALTDDIERLTLGAAIENNLSIKKDGHGEYYVEAGIYEVADMRIYLPKERPDAPRFNPNHLPEAVIRAADAFSPVMYANFILDDTHKKNPAEIADIVDMGLRFKELLNRTADSLSKDLGIQRHEDISMDPTMSVKKWLEESRTPVLLRDIYEEYDGFDVDWEKYMADNDKIVASLSPELRFTDLESRTGAIPFMAGVDGTDQQQNEMLRVINETYDAAKVKWNDMNLAYWPVIDRVKRGGYDIAADQLFDKDFSFDDHSYPKPTPLTFIGIKYDQELDADRCVIDDKFKIAEIPIHVEEPQVIKTGADIVATEHAVPSTIIQFADNFTRENADKLLAGKFEGDGPVVEYTTHDFGFKNYDEMYNIIKRRLDAAADRLSEIYDIPRAPHEMNIHELTEIDAFIRSVSSLEVDELEPKQFRIEMDTYGIGKGMESLPIPYSGGSAKDFATAVVRLSDAFDPDVYKRELLRKKENWSMTTHDAQVIADNFADKLEDAAMELSEQYRIERKDMLSPDSPVKEWYETTFLVGDDYPEELDPNATFADFKGKSPADIDDMMGERDTYAAVIIAEQTWSIHDRIERGKEKPVTTQSIDDIKAKHQKAGPDRKHKRNIDIN